MKLIEQDKNESFIIDVPIWISPNGNLLDIEIDAKFDLQKIKNAYPNLWRYEDAIAINQQEGIVSLNEGFTPIEKIKLNGKEVYIKHEQLFSTGSYKDRGATTLISKAKQLGVKKIVQDSSGNAGCAIAAYAPSLAGVPARAASGLARSRSTACWRSFARARRGRFWSASGRRASVTGTSGSGSFSRSCTRRSSDSSSSRSRTLAVSPTRRS